MGSTVLSAPGWGGDSTPGDLAADPCCLGTSAPRMSSGSGPFHSHSREFRAQEESVESWWQP